MRKLIEKYIEWLIICDNPQCDYKIPYSEEDKDIAKYLNKPCPKCGENLLTESDFYGSIKITMVIDWINKWFSWLTFFESKKSYNKRKSVEVHYHDGMEIKKIK
jgi:ssDNA-binding Zn-finger/Zn-ribbon topoisomerase 1